MRGRVGVRTAVLARGRVRFRAAARGGRARGDARWPRVELAFRWLGAPKKESRKIRVSLLCPLSKAFGVVQPGPFDKKKTRTKIMTKIHVPIIRFQRAV